MHIRIASTFAVILTLLLATLTPGVVAVFGRLMMSDEGKVHKVECGVCEESKCPRLNYCEGDPIKDSCNCCTVCSSRKYQPHVSLVGDDECGKVSCPKFKVCVSNLQGLPLCKCPSKFICRSKKKRTVCGKDGVTYESKCHMRIASCNQGVMVRKKHRGDCTPQDVREGEAYKRKMRRKLRRRQRQQKRKEEQENAKSVVNNGQGLVTEGGFAIRGSDPMSGSKDVGSSSALNEGRDLFDNRNNRKLIDDEMYIRKDNIKMKRRGKKNKGDDESSKKKRRRKRKKKRKNRKSRKGSKKDKKERRRKRRKRQHRPRSRSKRHRLIHPLLLEDDDNMARQRKFTEVFGHETWWSK